MYEDPIEVGFKDSVVIFDDIDVISDKKIRDAVYNILNKVLEIGRHFKITALVMNHLPTNGKDTRRILNEAHQVIYFPHSASGRIKYLLIDYLGLDKKMIQYFRKQNSRWCCIFSELSYGLHVRTRDRIAKPLGQRSLIFVWFVFIIFENNATT